MEDLYQYAFTQILAYNAPSLISGVFTLSYCKALSFCLQEINIAWMYLLQQEQRVDNFLPLGFGSAVTPLSDPWWPGVDQPPRCCTDPGQPPGAQSPGTEQRTGSGVGFGQLGAQPRAAGTLRAAAGEAGPESEPVNASRRARPALPREAPPAPLPAPTGVPRTPDPSAPPVPLLLLHRPHAQAELGLAPCPAGAGLRPLPAQLRHADFF